MLKDISLFICKAKSSRHMMVLKDGCIVILDCPGVLGLDEEVLIAAKVLEVMYGGWDEEGTEVERVEGGEGEKVGRGAKLVDGLADIGAMGLIVVGDFFISLLHSLWVVVEGVRINHHLGKQVMLLHQIVAHYHQLIVLRLFLNYKDVELWSFDQVQLFLKGRGNAYSDICP